MPINAGAEDAVVSEAFAKGGAGAANLAEAVVKAASKPSNFNFLYPLDLPIKEKISDNRDEDVRRKRDCIRISCREADRIFYEKRFR